MKILYPVFLFIFLLTSCAKEEDEVSLNNSKYTASHLHQIPYGTSGTLASGNYSGQGNVVNSAGTRVVIEGTVTVDALSSSGTVYVPEGATLIVNTVMTVGGGASMDVHGTLITQTYTQVGNTFLSEGKITVKGKYTIGGGTTLYMENAEVEAMELVVVGHIKAIENNLTQLANWYSMIELTGSQYLNRAGGTKVCGPVLFNAADDQGASGVAMQDVSSNAVTNNASVKVVYGLSQDAILYQYEDGCAGLPAMPNH